MAKPFPLSSITYSSPCLSLPHLFHCNFISTVTIWFFLLIPYSTALKFDYPILEQSNPSLVTEGNFTYLGSELELTTNKTDQIGRVRYFHQLQLWDNSSGKVAEVDFITNFSFIIYSNQRAPGDGIAFFLAKPPFLMPDITDGSGLGLVSHEELNSSSNPFVAVEFDTFQNQILDPRDSIRHVGVNVNSMISNVTTSWACDITIWKVYNATVSYVSRSKNLTVFLMPDITDGSGLGLVSHEELNSSSNPFVAVEFDTFQNQILDPRDSIRHVGVNVNSMISNVTTSWACDITIWKVYNATVSYVSRSKNLTVTFTGYIGKEPIEQNLHYEISLADYLPEQVTFGFSAANGLFTSRHILRSWSFESMLQEDHERSRNSMTGLVLGLSFGGSFVFVTLTGLICYVLCKKKRTQKEDIDNLNFDKSMDNDFERSSGARKFSYDELLSATNNFSEQEKLGQGRFGEVYRGFLRSLNSYVAIKRVSKFSSQGLKEYASEVKIISRLRHKNLVELIGWCHQKGDLLLVYEFMSNGSLDSRLFKQGSRLSWEARYNIAQGLASALLYLHEECEKCILHRDIKRSNVMLDSHLNAKLGDFGLARLVDHEKGSQTTRLAGTIGYMAPECVTTGKASKESDVYSFGVVALEIACGKKAVDPAEEDYEKGLVEWVWELYGMEKILDAVDPKLLGDFNGQQMERLMVVGLWCSHPDYNLRPTIKQVIQVLDLEAPLPILPIKTPIPTYLSPLDCSSSSSNNKFLYGRTGTSTDRTQSSSGSNDTRVTYSSVPICQSSQYTTASSQFDK